MSDDVHPYEDTPQYEQQYGNHGPGRPGNGLGNVWGTLADDDHDTWGKRHFRKRPASTSAMSGTEDEYFKEDEPDIDVADLLLAMEGLTERQRFVVECRFGLRAGSEGRALTLREIAGLLGISFQSVAEHERAGLRQLRAALGGDNNPSPS